MSNLSFEKVQMDTNFRNCQNVYNKLSKILEQVDVKQVGDINQINEKLLTLSTDMYKLLCVAESVFICDQKLKGNNVTSTAGLFNLNIAQVKFGAVNRHVECNIQNSIANDFGQHSLEATLVTKSCQSSYVIKEDAACDDNVTSNIGPFKFNAAPLTIKKTIPVLVNKHVQCNIQNSIPSALSQHSREATSVRKITKNCQTTDVIKDVGSMLNLSNNTSQTIIARISSEFYNNISYKYDGYFCNYCNITMKNVEDSIDHINSESHKNVCDFTSGFIVQLLNNVCNVGDFWSFIPQYLNISKFYVQPTGFTCTLCKCQLPCTLFAMYLHMSDKEHIKKVPTSLQLKYKNVFTVQ